jgi:uncharacterized protein (TIGR00303 family)
MTTTLSNAVLILHNPDLRADAFLARWQPTLSRRGLFTLCVGSTECSDLDGISAAGADGPSRRLAPAADAEALVMGRTSTAARIPVSPTGIASPVVLARAALSVLDCRIEVIDCGAFAPPQVKHLRAGGHPASKVSSGAALPEAVVRKLFAAGRLHGESISRDHAFLFIAECVPAGTTTALAVLSALGHACRNFASSSMPHNITDFRWQMVQEGLRKINHRLEDLCDDPLLAVAAVGDPMQAFAAGLAIGASEHCQVILSGGTQMLAVWSIMQGVLRAEARQHAPDAVAVITTRWVAFDKNANVSSIANLVQAPFVASSFTLARSRHRGLRAYEEGNVKEGVGAGAALAAACLAGTSETDLLNLIDDTYSLMLGVED